MITEVRLNAAQQEDNYHGKKWKDRMMQDQGLPVAPVYKAEPKYGIEFGFVIYATKDIGAVLLEDEMWHPFRYFDDGEWDVHDEGFFKPSSAFKLAVATYT